MSKEITDIVYINGTEVTLATKTNVFGRKLHDTYFYVVDYLDRHAKAYTTKTGNTEIEIELHKYDLKFEDKIEFLKKSVLFRLTNNFKVIEDESIKLKHFMV